MRGSDVGVVLVLPVESSSQIFPTMDTGSVQLVEPLKLSPLENVLKEMDP